MGNAEIKLTDEEREEKVNLIEEGLKKLTIQELEMMSVVIETMANGGTTEDIIQNLRHFEGSEAFIKYIEEHPIEKPCTKKNK